MTEAGVTNNVSVALQYLESWLRGVGAVAIYNLMEDAATAEISRSQLWQWRRNVVRLTDGRTFTPDLYRTIRDAEVRRLAGSESHRYGEAAEILDRLVLSDALEDFLTTLGYDYLE